MKQLQEALSKYLMMEEQLIAQRRRLQQKIPEIKNSLDTVKYLKDREVNL